MQTFVKTRAEAGWHRPQSRPADDQSVINALTIDVEDFFQVTAFEKQILRHQWDAFESRVVANTRRILRLLEFHDVRATFFILGWVARRYPALIRDIRRGGHEVGSHSYWHRLVYSSEFVVLNSRSNLLSDSKDFFYA